MIEVTLRVTGIDLDDESVEAAIAEHFPDTIWEDNEGLTTLTVFADRDDAVADVVDIVRNLELSFAGLKIAGVYRDLVGMTDVSLRAGVSREGARKWSLAADFPPPFDVVGAANMKVWAWTEIVTWLKESRALDMGVELPSLEMMTHIENCLMRNPDHTSVQWQHAATKNMSTAPAVFQTVKSTARVSAGGRAQRVTRSACDLVGAAARGRH